MANEDMAGKYLGGGSLEYVVQGGEIYFHSQQLTTILANAVTVLIVGAVQENSETGLEIADFVLEIAERMQDLRSELLKREAEKSLLD